MGGAEVVGWLWRGGQGSDAAGLYEELVVLKKLFLIYPEAIFGEVNGTPLQYSCLENPMDGGAW